MVGRSLTFDLYGVAVPILAFFGGTALLGHHAVEASRTYTVGDLVAVTVRRIHNYLAPRANSLHRYLFLTFSVMYPVRKPRNLLATLEERGLPAFVRSAWVPLETMTGLTSSLVPMIGRSFFGRSAHRRGASRHLTGF